MGEWVVRWEIELGASSAREAAEEARRIQRDPSARAGAFIVIEASGAATWAIDLDD